MTNTVHRAIALLGVVAIFLSALPACAARLKLAVTLSDVVPIVEAVGGDQVQAEHIMPPGSDPHSFTISAKVQTRLQQADLIVYARSDFLHFEEHIREALPDKPSLDWPDYTPHGAALKDFTGYPQCPHGFWLDITNARAIAQAVAQRLIDLGADAGAINAGRTRFMTELQALESASSQIAEANDAQGRKIVAAIPGVAYSIANAGMEVGEVLLREGAGFAGGRELKAIVDKLASGEFFGIACPISMKDAKPGEVARQVAQDADCPVIYVQFLSGSEAGGSFLSQAYFNAAALTAADRAPNPTTVSQPISTESAPTTPASPITLHLFIACLFLLAVVIILAITLRRQTARPTRSGAGIFDDKGDD